jgi:hypothetical protein
MPADPPLTSAGPPPPRASDEQKAYWQEDLKLKRRQLAISLLGFAGVITALALNYNAWRTSGRSLRANTQLSMMRLMTDFDRVFVEHPELRSYFHEGEAITESNTNYNRAYATAVLMLDVLDAASVQSSYFGDVWRDPEGWEHWVTNSIATIPIVAKALREDTNSFPGLTRYVRSKKPGEP